MLGKTHTAIGAMTGAALLPLLRVTRPEIVWPHALQFVFSPASMVRMTDLLVAVIGIGCAAVGALLPDIDEPHSTIAREVAPLPILSRRITMLVTAGILICVALAGRIPMQTAAILSIWLAVAALVKHRGLTHSIVGFGLSFFAIRALDSGLAYAFSAGYASHLVADMLTDHGVVLFWPWPKRIRIPVGLHTGGIFEWPLRVVAGLFTLGTLLTIAGGAPIIHAVQSWI